MRPEVQEELNRLTLAVNKRCEQLSGGYEPIVLGLLLFIAKCVAAKS
jgi:hypothetical protein